MKTRESLLLAIVALFVLFSSTLAQTPTSGTVNRNANIRSGPATTNAIVGRATDGQVVNIVGCNADCSWYQIADTQWIAAFLVDANNISDQTSEDCDSSYPDLCIPLGASDLDCNEVSKRSFRVIGTDPHNFDADADGIGCELDTGSTSPAGPQAATANANANLRSGPGTTYSVVGRASSGQPLVLTGRNVASDWYQLKSGEWIAAFLVANAPSTLPVANGTASGDSVIVDPLSISTPTAVPTPEPTATTGGCDTNYAGACVPLVSHDLDCPDIGKRFTRVGADPHRFDADNDGIACESY